MSEQPAGEFSLIERLFKGQGGSSKAFTRLGIGDDASIHQPQPGMDLVVSSDSSVQGIHWPEDFPLDLAADKAVCSALSDLAAMGAEPLCVWLNVMANDSRAVEQLGAGATRALRCYDVELAGGDTSRSPTNAVAVTVTGQLPAGSAMRRDAADCTDHIWFTGRSGLHALGLHKWLSGDKNDTFTNYFKSITPQLSAGIQLRQQGVCCCIDVSDGLLQDAGHIARASAIGMDIELSHLPDWSELRDAVGEDQAMQLIAHGGEDYALLFTAHPNVPIPDGLATRIGRCRQGAGVNILVNGNTTDIRKTGYDHFS